MMKYVYYTLKDIEKLKRDIGLSSYLDKDSIEFENMGSKVVRIALKSVIKRPSVTGILLTDEEYDRFYELVNSSEKVFRIGDYAELVAVMESELDCSLAPVEVATVSKVSSAGSILEKEVGSQKSVSNLFKAPIKNRVTQESRLDAFLSESSSNLGSFESLYENNTEDALVGSVEVNRPEILDGSVPPNVNMPELLEGLTLLDYERIARELESSKEREKSLLLEIARLKADKGISDNSEEFANLQAELKREQVKVHQAKFELQKLQNEVEIERNQSQKELEDLREQIKESTSNFKNTSDSQLLAFDNLQTSLESWKEYASSLEETKELQSEKLKQMEDEIRFLERNQSCGEVVKKRDPIFVPDNVEFYISVSPSDEKSDIIHLLQTKDVFIDLNNYSYMDGIVRIQKPNRVTKWLVEGKDIRTLFATYHPLDVKVKDGLLLASHPVAVVNLTSDVEIDWNKALAQLSGMGQVGVYFGLPFEGLFELMERLNKPVCVLQLKSSVLATRSISKFEHLNARIRKVIYENS